MFTFVTSTSVGRLGQPQVAVTTTYMDKLTIQTRASSINLDYNSPHYLLYTSLQIILTSDTLVIIHISFYY